MHFFEVIFYIFVAVITIQYIYYVFVFARLAYYRPKKLRKKNIPVSIIICAKNEAKNLKTFLPSIIDQDYSNFEIVLINDGSHDDTLKTMEAFKTKHKNIKVVDVKNVEPFWGNKKYALTLGIKSASHNYLLFTDADCKPISRTWITQMSSHFSKTKTIVLGFSPYKTIKNSFLNLFIQFETFITSVLYGSFAKIGLPYMGIGRNLAYKKDEFFKANGFASHMHLKSGDDDLFINQIANRKNTSLCLSPESIIISLPKTSFVEFFRQKRRHISTSQYYHFKHKILLSLFYLSQLLFWVLAIVLLSHQISINIVIPLIVIRFLFQYTIFGFLVKKFKVKSIMYVLPILECFLIVFQLSIFIANLIVKPNHWK